MIRDESFLNRQAVVSAAKPPSRQAAKHTKFSIKAHPSGSKSCSLFHAPCMTEVQLSSFTSRQARRAARGENAQCFIRQNQSYGTLG